MRRPVYSALASENLETIIDYIEDEFGVDRAIKYFSDYEDFLRLLCISPELFAPFNMERRPGLHKAVFQTKTIILYRFTDWELNLELVADARSDWEKLYR